MFQADPWGILTLVAVAMCWALAITLFRVGVPGSTARKLALLLFVEGVTLGFSGASYSLFVSINDTFSQYPLLETIEKIVHTLGDCALLALYPAFLAVALQTTLTRPFANKRVQLGLAGYAAMLFFAVMYAPFTVGFTLLYLSLALVFGFALVASIQAWRIATGAARQRALIFVLAFGFRDLCWGLVYGISFWEVFWIGAIVPELLFDTRTVVYVLGTLIAVPLIGYGILRAQLFDIDLHIRWTIKQSTLAAAVVAIIFLLSEGASELLSAEFGSVGGLLAAALVVFFLAPLQRFAERVAAAAMPNTENTPEYAAFRKMQVYEEAVAEANYEGGISQKERALLVRLRDSLGISESDAETIEGELQTRLPSFA